ncbi:MAG: lipocalin family protein [Bacteroidota bacterium]
MKKLLIAAFAVTLAFSACKDDKDDATPATPGQTGSAALTGKDWRMTANTYVISGSGSDDGTTDLFAEKEACEKDDLTRFNDDKTMTEKAGATKCDPSDPDSKPGGTWELMNNNTKLKVTDGNDPIIFDIVTLNETTLTIKSIDTDAGVTSTINASFTKN